MSEFRSIFDGVSLAGWRPIGRLYGDIWPDGPSAYADLHPEGFPELARQFPAAWTVEDGAIVGRQNAERAGYGGYLLSEEQFGDFELVVETKPDWPADTGVMLRRGDEDSWSGYQVLVDHRREGSIGGFYGNGLASFHTIPFTLDVQRDEAGRPTGLVEFGPEAEPGLQGFRPEKRTPLAYAADASDFLGAWRWGDWNELRVRCVGGLPVLTTWVNGVKIAELDTAELTWPNFAADAVRKKIGRRGRLALEVHDLAPGAEFWGKGSACRWRSMRVKDLD